MGGDYDLLFCNDLANRITRKVLNVDSKEKKFDTQLLTSPMFFEYKVIQQNDQTVNLKATEKADATQNGTDGKCPSFTLNDVAKMSQDQISQIVFSFSKSVSETNFFDKKNDEYYFVRDALKSAPNMSEIPNSYLPTFQLFQIKKGMTKSNDGLKRCTL